jgi:transcriptional regulator with XRE-family HTH domain
MDTYVTTDELPATLRRVRRAHRLTQAEFAAKVDLSAGAIGRIESGDMRTVSAETTVRLAELLATMSDEVAS